MFLRRLGFVSAVVMAMTMISACDQPRPIPPGTDRVYYGHLLEGEKFGISVGMSQEEAVRILTAQGFGHVGLLGCTAYAREVIDCNSSDAIHSFRRRKIGRHGTVFLNIVDDRVDSISWTFVVLYVDF